MEVLVEYIYTTLGMDLDYILPFAGIPENSREIDGLDDRSEPALAAYNGCSQKREGQPPFRHPAHASHPTSFPQSWAVWQRWTILRTEPKIALETLFQH